MPYDGKRAAAAPASKQLCRVDQLLAAAFEAGKWAEGLTTTIRGSHSFGATSECGPADERSVSQVERGGSASMHAVLGPRLGTDS